MKKQAYLKLLVEKIHSTTIATIGADGHPQTRVIDRMLWDEGGVYFLTAKGKAFYAQLMEQGYIALLAVKEKISISIKGKTRCIGQGKLDEIFEKNPYIKKFTPGTRAARWRCFACMKRTANILTSAARRRLCATALPSEKKNSGRRAII